MDMDMDRIRIRESQTEYYNTRTATTVCYGGATKRVNDSGH